MGERAGMVGRVGEGIGLGRGWNGAVVGGRAGGEVVLGLWSGSMEAVDEGQWTSRSCLKTECCTRRT